MQRTVVGMNMPGRRSARWRAACVAVASMLVAACTTVVDGVAATAPGGPPPGAVDVALLNTGNYPTRPQPPLGKAGTRFRGGAIEAARMASSVVGPWEIDSRLTDPGLAANIIEDADEIPLVEHDEGAAAAGRHSFVNGFASSRRSEPDQMSFVNAVLRSPMRRRPPRRPPSSARSR
jgi:hypothetical protein